MAGPRALVLDVEAPARLDEHDVLLFVQAAEKSGYRDLERLGKPGERGQAGRRLGVLDLRQHAFGQTALGGELSHRPPQLQAELPDPGGDRGPQRLFQALTASGPASGAAV